MNFVNLDGVLIHYKYVPAVTPANAGNTFVFINSLGTDYRIWDDVVTVLKEEGNILLFDKRGHGLSGITIKSKGLETYTTDMLGLMKHLSIEKVIVVGLSIGGMIAQLFAYNHPEKVDKLILCDTRHKIGNLQIWNERIADVKAQGMKGISAAVMLRWFPEKFWEENYATVAGCQMMLERVLPMGYIQACEAIRDADLATVAKRLKTPTLCVVGSEDRSTPPEYMRDLADLIKDVRFEVIKGSGHIPCVDNPVALSKLIVEFIKRDKALKQD